MTDAVICDVCKAECDVIGPAPSVEVLMKFAAYGGHHNVCEQCAGLAPEPAPVELVDLGEVLAEVYAGPKLGAITGEIGPIMDVPPKSNVIPFKPNRRARRAHAAIRRQGPNGAA